MTAPRLPVAWPLIRPVARCDTGCYVPRDRPSRSRGRGALRQSSCFVARSACALPFRWLHIIAGITWIGLLYYFNFVQVPAFAEMRRRRGAQRAPSTSSLAAALWWFRWAARCDRSSPGILITRRTKDYWRTSFGKSRRRRVDLTGMLLGIDHAPERVGRHLAQPEGGARQRGQRAWPAARPLPDAAAAGRERAWRHARTCCSPSP